MAILSDWMGAWPDWPPGSTTDHDFTPAGFKPAAFSLLTNNVLTTWLSCHLSIRDGRSDDGHIEAVPCLRETHNLINCLSGHTHSCILSCRWPKDVSRWTTREAKVSTRNGRRLSVSFWREQRRICVWDYGSNWSWIYYACPVPGRLANGLNCILICAYWLEGIIFIVVDCISFFCLRFLPARRYASAGLCDSDVSVCLSVRPSHAGIVPSRAKAGSWNVHHLIAP